MACLGIQKAFSLVLALLLCAALGIFVFLTPDWNIGKRDFIAYWSAFQAWSDGQDPYQTGNLKPYQDAAGLTLEQTQPFLNPPWTLVLMAPFLCWDLGVSSKAWMFVSAGYYLLLPLLWLGNGRHPKQAGYAGVALLWTFLPAHFCLFLGNQTLVLALCFGLFMKCLKEGRDVATALAALPLASKPQLMFLCCLVCCAYLVIGRRWKPLLWAGTGFLLINLALLWQRPSLFMDWAHSDFSPWQCHTSSWISVIRWNVIENGGWDIRGLAFLPAFFAAVLTIILIFVCRKKMDLDQWTSYSLFGACLVSPYVWLHDYALLTVPFLVTISRADDGFFKTRKWIEVLFWWLALLAVTVLTFFHVKTMHDYYFLPFVLLAVWLRVDWLVARKSKSLVE